MILRSRLLFRHSRAGGNHDTLSHHLVIITHHISRTDFSDGLKLPCSIVADT